MLGGITAFQQKGLDLSFLGRYCSSCATIVIQHGTLRPGDILVAEHTWCRIKSLLNEKGEKMDSAPPSSPVLTMGWRDLPTAGELCLQVCLKASEELSYKEWPSLLIGIQRFLNSNG